VFGVLAVSYKVDPAYLPAHSKTALTEWYEIKNAAEIENYKFGTSAHEGYNHYRRCFLARAGFGAGMLDDKKSWALAYVQCRNVQRDFKSWKEFADSYLAGHLAHRKSQGDSAEQLAQFEKNIRARSAEVAKETWASIPFESTI
jgi:Protein of unknown function (DUF1266)